MCTFIVVVITRPPENTTVCRGSRVIISCGHNSTADTVFDTIWSINGTGARIITLNDPLYQTDNQTLIVFSINYITTFQCVVHIRESSMMLQSTTGTVTVVGMYYVCTYVFIRAETNICLVHIFTWLYKYLIPREYSDIQRMIFLD